MCEKTLVLLLQAFAFYRYRFKSNSQNIVEAEEFWKVIIIIEIYYYILGSLLVQLIYEKIFVLLLHCVQNLQTLCSKVSFYAF